MVQRLRDEDSLAFGLLDHIRDVGFCFGHIFSRAGKLDGGMATSVLWNIDGDAKPLFKIASYLSTTPNELAVLLDWYLHSIHDLVLSLRHESLDRRYNTSH